jgi:hypothetical protein
MSKTLRRLLIALGAPRDQSPQFYQDVALTVPFVIGGLIAFSLAAEGKFGLMFWMSVIVSALAVFPARKRGILLGGLFAFAGVRFAFAFIVTMNWSMLAVSILCLAVTIIIVASDKSDYAAHK